MKKAKLLFLFFPGDPRLRFKSFFCNAGKAYSSVFYSIRKGQQGAVLVLVLFVLAALAVLTVEFNKDVLLDHTLSVSTRSVLTSRSLLQSGEQMATAVLLENSVKGDPDHLHEDWANFNKQLLLLSRELQSGDISGNISDENSRFPLNAIFYEKESERSRAEAFTRILKRLLIGLMRLHGYSGSIDNAGRSAENFILSLQEWAGQISISERSLRWYRQQTPRYLPPGRLFISPEELLLVYWPDVDEKWSRFVLKGEGNKPGLIALVTTLTQGPLNINTLVPSVLAAFVDDEHQAKAFVAAILAYRGNKDNVFSDNWYRDIASQYGADIAGLPKDCLDVRSRWYRVEVTVQTGARKNMLTSIGWVTQEFITWEYRFFQ